MLVQRFCRRDFWSCLGFPVIECHYIYLLVSSSSPSSLSSIAILRLLGFRLLPSNNSCSRLPPPYFQYPSTSSRSTSALTYFLLRFFLSFLTSSCPSSSSTGVSDKLEIITHRLEHCTDQLKLQSVHRHHSETYPSSKAQGSVTRASLPTSCHRDLTLPHVGRAIPVTGSLTTQQPPAS